MSERSKCQVSRCKDLRDQLDEKREGKEKHPDLLHCKEQGCYVLLQNVLEHLQQWSSAWPPANYPVTMTQKNTTFLCEEVILDRSHW